MINFEKSECLERTDKKNEEETTGTGYDYQRKNFVVYAVNFVVPSLPCARLFPFVYSSQFNAPKRESGYDSVALPLTLGLPPKYMCKKCVRKKKSHTCVVISILLFMNFFFDKQTRDSRATHKNIRRKLVFFIRDCIISVRSTPKIIFFF